MSKANKRERQRLNREARREYEEALEKRRRRMKTLKGFAIVAVPVIVIGVVLSIMNSGGDDDTTSAKPKTYKQAPETIIDPATTTYSAVLETSEGNITIGLDAVAAPTSVNNFVFLAKEGFYDGLDFHRIAKDFVIQGGDPNGDGTGGPGYKVQAELPANGYTIGSVAWAKGGNEPAGTAGSQFFIVTSDQGAVNLGGPPYQYGIIGQVTDGIDTVDAIAAFAPASGDGKPSKKVTIKKVSILEAPTTPSS